MGKKKAAADAVNPKELPPQWWCYYCDTRHKDEEKLVQHQRSKHFLCRFCDPNAKGRNCMSLGGLLSHVRRSHRKDLDAVPGAIEGRDSLDIEISAMQGIPADALAAFHEQLAEEMRAAKPEAPPLPDGDGMAPLPDEPPAQLADLANRLACRMSESATPAQSAKEKAQLAVRLASQISEHTAAVLNPVSTDTSGVSKSSDQDMPAFDPAMLAARIAASQAAEEEEARRKEVEAKTREIESRRKAELDYPPPEEPDVDRDRDRRDGRDAGFERGGRSKRNDGFEGGGRGRRDRDDRDDRTRDDDRRRKDKDRSRSRRRREPSRSFERKHPGRNLKYRPRSVNRSEEREQDKKSKRRDDKVPEDRYYNRDRNRGFEQPPGRARNRDDEVPDDRERRRRDDDGDDRRRRDRDNDDRKKEEKPRDEKRDAPRDAPRDEPRDAPRGRSRSAEAEKPEAVDEPAAKRSRRSKWGPEEAAPEMPEMPEMAIPEMPRVLKTEMCMSFTEGLCTKGELCPFAHSLRDLAPGGIKPRLCPNLMRGFACPRKEMCLFAHKKEELPRNFKMILCQNFKNSFCRKQSICQLAHGWEEQQWFTKFMNSDGNLTGENGAAITNATTPPKTPGLQAITMGPPAGAGGGPGGPGLADNLLAAAEQQLAVGKAIPNTMPSMLALENKVMPQLPKLGGAVMPQRPNPMMFSGASSPAFSNSLIGNSSPARPFGGMGNLGGTPLAPRGVPFVPGVVSSSSQGPGPVFAKSTPEGAPFARPAMPFQPEVKLGGPEPFAKGMNAMTAKAMPGGISPMTGGISPMTGGVSPMTGGINPMMMKAPMPAMNAGVARPNVNIGPKACMKFLMGGCTLGEACPLPHREKPF